MKNQYALLLILLMFISSALMAQDRIILKKTGKPIPGKLKIIKVANDTILYTIKKKKKKLPLALVHSYALFDVKTNKSILHIVPLPSSVIKPRILIPDPNAEYIRDHARSDISYKKEHFVPGYIVKLNKDTLKCKIIKNPDEPMNDHLYIVALEEDEVISIYEPKDIVAYGREDELYKSYRSNKDSIDTAFFIKQIADGKAEMFERAPIPSDFKQAYFVKVKGSDNYYYVAPDKDDMEVFTPDYTFQAGEQNTSTYRSVQIAEEFKTTFADILKNCPEVQSKLLNGTYKMKDIKTIIAVYNNKCGKNN